MQMNLKMLAASAAAAAVLAAAGAANAAYVFVGSWEVDQGPYWPAEPPAYTGQEAAALLFGGNPGDYTISSVDSDPTHIDFQNWISTWGSDPSCNFNFPCGTLAPENFKVASGGLYANPGDTSAYVRDWAIGSQFTNYAFTGSATPEPAEWALMLGGFGLAGAALRRRRQALA
jgi:hypothetical protein